MADEILKNQVTQSSRFSIDSDLLEYLEDGILVREEIGTMTSRVQSFKAWFEGVFFKMTKAISGLLSI